MPNTKQNEQSITQDEQNMTKDEQNMTQDEQNIKKDEQSTGINKIHNTPFTYRYRCACCKNVHEEDFYLNKLTRTYCHVCIKNMAVDSGIRDYCAIS